jgi:hypothetical protein|tara:strand:- start:67 stop:567 length:501 start_codon:yes stop_codon:yes gene_type:complete
MALTENEKKLGPLTKKPKKKLTMKERQPIRFGKGIFDGLSNQPDRMFRKQRKKSAVSGQMKGAPINTTGAPKYTTVNKPKQAGDIKKGVKVYKSNGNAVPGDRAVKKKAPITPSLISKNTPSSINRMDKTKSKKTKVVTPAKKKKLTLQQKAQESMGFKVGGRFGY